MNYVSKPAATKYVSHLRHGLYLYAELPAVSYLSKPAAIMYVRHHETHLRHGLYLCAGLPAVKPDFMKPNRGRRRRAVEDLSHSDSDEEWRPRPKRKSGKAIYLKCTFGTNDKCPLR